MVDGGGGNDLRAMKGQMVKKKSSDGWLVVLELENGARPRVTI